MTTQELMQEIMRKNPLISQMQILEQLQAEKERTGGLLGDETLLRLIAAKFGIKVQQNIIQSSGVLSTNRLLAGLYDVTVAGRLIAIFPAKTFQTAENSGKFVTLMVGDSEGIVRVILWNEKTELVEKGELKVGQALKLLHAYTKDDRYGKVEVHLGTKSKIEVEAEAKMNQYIPIEKFTAKISSLSLQTGSVNLLATVREILGESTFIRNDTSVGIVTRLAISDDSGETTIVFWNEKAEELEAILKSNARLLLLNARVKEGQSGGIEVHVDQNTFVEFQEASKQTTKISALIENHIINVEGTILAIRENKEVTTSKGETIKLLAFDLRDETGTVRVSAWREQAETLKNLKIDQTLRLENVYVKRTFGGKLELTTRMATLACIVTL